jgi:hypothetical protein
MYCTPRMAIIEIFTFLAPKHLNMAMNISCITLALHNSLLASLTQMYISCFDETLYVLNFVRTELASAEGASTLSASATKEKGKNRRG